MAVPQIPTLSNGVVFDALLHYNPLVNELYTWANDRNASGKRLINLAVLGLKSQALPASPAAGYVAFDSSDNSLKVYNGSAWVAPGQQSPWRADIDAAAFNLSNLGNASFAAGKTLTGLKLGGAADGNVQDVSNLGNVTLAANKLITAPGQIRARAVRTSAQSIPNVIPTAITLETADGDIGAPAGIWSSSTNPDRLTVPTGADGLYLIIGQASFAPPSSALGTMRSLSVTKNGIGIAQSNLPPAGANIYSTNVMVMTLAKGVAGDYFKMNAFQDSGGALNVGGAGTNSSWFSFYKLA
jgi:hypothetical protein